MASNGRPQFKHPLPTVRKEPKELTWVTQEDLAAAVKPDTGLAEIVWHGLKVIVRHMIGLSEMQNLVDIVWHQCRDEEGLHAELMDFQMRCAVITFYTNVNLPDTAEEQYEMLYGTDLYEAVTQHISQPQLRAVEDALRMYMSR